jgi:phosphoribosylanthranilate isomerase
MGRRWHRERTKPAGNDERLTIISMTWIKICGITNLEDALVAAEAGADAIGFVFYEKSPRLVTPDTALEISRHLSSRIERVGVFVNQTEDVLCDVADDAALTAMQMHGDNEDPHVADLVVARRPLKVFVGISMHRPNPDGWASTWDSKNVFAFLADSGSPAKLGGTGQTFDWQASQEALSVLKGLSRLVLAGGLNPDNVGEAIRITMPWGVDVSSGVEASPGKKDPEKVRAFIRAVREADQASQH